MKVQTRSSKLADRIFIRVKVCEANLRNAPDGPIKKERKGLDMRTEGLNALAARVESADEASTALVSEVAEALTAAYPAAASRAVLDAALLTSTDAALRVVDGAVPAWEISLRGVALEPNGHWHCTLRETSATDDDAIIGFGEAPSLPCALIAALLRIAAMRTDD